MAHDPLGALHQAMGRLLLVGGPAAASDDALAALAPAVADLAQRAPALAPLQASLERLRSSKGREASQALLDLVVVLGRVRAAQARLAPLEGELAPLPPAEPLPSEADADEVWSLRRALRQPGGPRAVLAQPFHERRALDLRLVGPWLDELESDASWKHILREVVPRLGERALTWLSPLYDEKGGTIDGRRLEALCVALGPERSRPLLDRALEQGAPWVRASAIRALAAIDPEAAEPFALEALSDLRLAAGLRESSAEALATSSSDRALELLVRTLSDEGPGLGQVAAEALRASRHPKAGERLSALLAAEVLALPILRHTGAVAPGEEHRVAKVERVLRALTPHLDEATGAKVVDLAKGHRLEEIRKAAMAAVLDGAPAPTLVLLLQQLSATFPYQQLLASLAESAKRGEARAVPALVALLDRIDKSDRYVVYHALVALGDPRVLEPLRARAKRKVLDERERALFEDAVTKLEGRGR